MSVALKITLSVFIVFVVSAVFTNSDDFDQTKKENEFGLWILKTFVVMVILGIVALVLDLIWRW